MVALIIGVVAGSVVGAAIYIAIMYRVAHAGRQ